MNKQREESQPINSMSSISATTPTSKMVGVPFCPDMLNYHDLGEADNMYGRIVRGFFWLLRWFPNA